MLSRRQSIFIILMFNFGSSVVIGVSSGVEQDAWISLLVALCYACVATLMYARIMQLNPGMDLFSIIESILGKFIGKLAIAIMSWYALHLCALVLRNFSEFIKLSALLETPQLPVLILMLGAVIYLAKIGVKALGMWAIATTPIVLSIVTLTVLLSLNVMNFTNVLPVLEHSPSMIVKDAYQIFSFPFGETILFLAIADSIPSKHCARSIYIPATLLSGGILLIVILRNLLVLGASVVTVEYFPSYAAARIINLADFLSRIEGSISVNFILAGITKITLCLIAASRGIAKLFNLPDHRRLVVPCALLAMALALILYDNTMQMFGFIKYYPLYALPFQIAIPAILWVPSELRARRARMKHAS
jgi:spore germination protein KB